MLEHLNSILMVTGIIVIALISPGPDFAIVVKNSVVYSRRTALFTALGITLGALVHVSYILLGFGLIISKSKILFTTFKFLGATYLIYIGIKGLKSKKKNINLEIAEVRKDISESKAFSIGFLTNLLNPKAMLFFLSLFSALMTQNTPEFMMIIYASIIFITTIAWFSLVACFFSTKKSRQYFNSFGYLIDRITGGILVAFGLKLVFLKD